MTQESLLQRHSFATSLPQISGFQKGVIHKTRGQIFGYFGAPPPSLSLLVNKPYVVYV